MRNFEKTMAVALVFSATLGSSAGAESVPFSSDRWEMDAENIEIVDHDGREDVLLLKEGHALLPDADFLNGIITYDIKFPPGLAFVGPMVRAQSVGDFERFYMRLHLSGKPDATQYTPYFNKMTSWQLYPQYGGETAFKFNEWNQVKAVFADEKAEFYLNDMEIPVITVDRLRHDAIAGGVGVVMERIPFMELTPVYISNFEFTKSDAPGLKGTYADPEPPPAGTVMQWQVSSIFDQRDHEGASMLDGASLETEWTTVDAEHTGLVNIARYRAAETLLETGQKTGLNAVVAKLDVQSDSDQIKKLSFGFSDNVWVYVNGRIVMSASDTWSSRDYRFLGTIGYWDDVYLDLKQGMNEVLFMVSESMPDDGWGIQARFEDLDGIELR